MLIGTGYAAMIVYAVLFGMSVCVGLNYAVLTIPTLFGKKEIKGITGFGNFAFYLGCLIGPVVSGALFDAFGNYNIAIYIMLAFIAVYIFLTLVNLRKGNAYKPE